MDSFIIKCDLVSGVFHVSSASFFGDMPSDIVSIAVSTGLGVSVLAGILSGVCYLWTQKVQKSRRNRKTRHEWYCEVCGTYLRSIDGILEGDRVVTCSKCQARICKGRCSKLKEETEWICINCLDTPESWFRGILNALQLHKKVELGDKMNKDSFNELDEDIEALRKKEKERIRDFIEQLVNALIGGNVDDASVSKMYNDKEYLPLQGQSPCTAHASLKQFIERLIQESLQLPLLQKVQDHPARPNEETNRTYEDLLATAIINKVISGAQNRLSNSAAASVSSRISNSSRREDKEYFFGEETLDNKWKTTDFETTSVSSVEDWLHSDSSFGSKKYVDRETLTIKHDIEVSQSDSEEDDDNEYFRSRSSLLGDDEPNWFLQKRHFQTASPVPVPMLVPKPATDAKVLIGDKEIDETSDLSDIASDYGEPEIVPGTQSVLIESKTIIGGKNPLHSGSDGESSADSGVKEVDRDRSGYDEPDFVTKTDITVDDDNVEDASILSVYSNTEKEAEYTERYGSLPRTILKTPTPPSRPSLNKIKQNAETNLEISVEKPDIENSVQSNQEILSNGKEHFKEETDDGDVESLFEGSYSKKEKEKWKHAIEMKNNPYSKENIEKRITRSKSPFDTLFGPDYYARQASSPSGSKVKNSEVNDLIWSFQPSGSEVDEDSRTLQTTQEDPPNKQKIENVSAVNGKQLKTESSLELSITEMNSDSDLSCINYYDVEKSEVYKKSKDEITTKKSEGEHKNVSDEKNRPLYIKTTSTISTPKYNKNTNGLKKRHKSESDLIVEDSFDAPPKVLGRKKDNTLISKIYSQPHVRNFAITSRKQFLADLTSPTSVTPSIYETSRYNGGVTLYNSEGEMSHDRKSIQSSTEDLIEPALKSHSFIRSTSAIINDQGVRKSSMSSEDDVLSEHSTSIVPTGKRNSRHQIYSSSDDLFSIEEHDKPHKKKDNTLIDKIYQNRQVRNYGLASRDYIPVQEDNTTPSKKGYTSEDEISEIKFVPTTVEILASERITRPPDLLASSQETSKVKQSVYGKDYDLHLMSEMSLDKDNEEIYLTRLDPSDPEIDEIAKKRIVHSFLDKFATTSRLAGITRKTRHTDTQDFNESENEVYVSVREMRKKFENNNAKSEVKSSLTARSLSKKLREQLKR